MMDTDIISASAKQKYEEENRERESKIEEERNYDHVIAWHYSVLTLGWITLLSGALNTVILKLQGKFELS